MRKGAKRVEWTVGEVRYLLEHAGVEPKRSICRHLKRSGASVRTKAERLRREGYDLNLRVYAPLTVICPKCSQARSKLGRWQGRAGFCEVCGLRASYEKALYDQAEAYAALTPAQRWRYDREQAGTGRSEVPPRPRAPQTMGLSPPRARRAEELHAIDVERWEVAYLTRLRDAAKKRTQRMRELSGTNPRKGRNR